MSADNIILFATMFEQSPASAWLLLALMVSSIFEIIVLVLFILYFEKKS